MSSQQSEYARTEQIITQFQLKALQAILGSRIPNLARPITDPAGARRRDRWFNLALGDLPSALENPSHGVMDPVVVDVILSPADVILERWTAVYDLSTATPAGGGEGSLYRRAAYKRSIVLLRSLYSLLRLLPCFKIFKMLAASNQSYNYDLSYRVSSFAAPFSREEEKELAVYPFAPIDTQFGHLSLSVSYRPDLSEFNFEVSSLMPAMIIADYVGSPAADPMRAFPVSPAHKSTGGGAGSGSRPISYPLRNFVSGSNSPISPALPAFQRPHSWSEVRSAPIDVYKNRIPPSQKSTGTHKKGAFSFDEYRLSPPMSNSPTPSPPAYGSSSNSMQSRLRLETAPVSIPAGVSGKSQFPRTPNHSDPMRNFLPPPSPRSTRMEQSSQESPSSESRSFRKLEGLKLGDFYSNLHLYNAQKGLKDGRDDSGRFSGVFSSSGSPRLFSRSSSRLSIQDDLDDIDFSCPFAVDDVDMSDSQSRNLDGKEVPESSQSYNSSHKSQDAAVGALVHMLRTAAPLRQDPSYSSHSSRSEVTGEVGNSSFFVARKTSDALDELKSYREMKEILLSQSRVQLLDSLKQTTE